MSKPYDKDEYITLSESQQYKKCKETPIFMKTKMKELRGPFGYCPSEAVALIKKLRAEGYSSNSEILRNEAIRRLRREF